MSSRLFRSAAKSCVVIAHECIARRRLVPHSAKREGEVAGVVQWFRLGVPMKLVLTATTLILGLIGAAGVSPVAAQAQADGKKFEKGSTVTLQGCVVAAEKK